MYINSHSTRLLFLLLPLTPFSVVEIGLEHSDVTEQCGSLVKVGFEAPIFLRIKFTG